MATTRVRYSTGKVATSEEAKAFPWENPVPVNAFWDDINYPTARSFLSVFTEEELQKEPIDAASKADLATKFRLLLERLQEKLSGDEAKASPAQSLFETNHNHWYALWRGIYAMQYQLKLPEAEQTLRMLVAREKPENKVPQMMLAEFLVEQGKYKEAEDIERPVLAHLDAAPHLGRDSPQSLSARRIIVQALWGQGEVKRAEAQAGVQELNKIVDAMGGGKFGVYQEEETTLNKEMMNKLETAV